ncbi:MAG: hypothetical protein WC841_02970 [Candidatus Shapirobacteria bacterium]|jgi:hypothetical protein
MGKTLEALTIQMPMPGLGAKAREVMVTVAEEIPPAVVVVARESPEERAEGLKRTAKLGRWLKRYGPREEGFVGNSVPRDKD